MNHSFATSRPERIGRLSFLGRGEEIPDMALLDLIVETNFRGEQGDRMVVFHWDGRHWGFLLKSETEELRIKAFLKMYYFAQLSILSLGCFLASEWARELSYELGRPFAVLFRIGITLGLCSIIVVVPIMLLWRSYKKALVSFVCVEDAVAVSAKSANGRWIINVGLIALGIVMVLVAMLLARGTSVAK